MENQSSTGTYSFVGDFLIALALIGGGVLLVLWFSTLASSDKGFLISRVGMVFAVIVAVPGCLLTVKILKSQKPLRHRLIMGAACFGILAFAGPALLGDAVSAHFISLFGR